MPKLLETSGGSASGRTVGTDTMCDLLRCYRGTLHHAETLPAVLWMRTRPAGCSPLARWWRLPRLTLGTSVLVRYHIIWSVDALIRAYAAQAALGELDERGKKERAILVDFRESLRPVNMRYFVLAAVVAALLIGRVIVGALAQSSAKSFYFLALGLESITFDQFKDRLNYLTSALDGFASASSSMSGGSIYDLVNRPAGADPIGLLVFFATLLAAFYCVLRPASTAFRLKRMLFNLADESAPALSRTTSTWHVSRSVGLYQQEQKVFATAGVQGGKEKPFDLFLSGLATVLVGWALISYASAPNPMVGPIEIILIVFLVVARLAWLAQTYVSRNCSGALWQAPTGAVLPASGRVVDIRPTTEAFLFPFAWYRLSRQLSDLRANARARQGGLPGKQRMASVTALLSTILLSFSIFCFYVLLLVARVWCARRLAPRGIRDPGIWAMIAVAGGWLVAFVTFWWGPPGSVRENIGFVLLLMFFFIGMAAAQFLHNRIVREYAGPLHFDAIGEGSRLA